MTDQPRFDEPDPEREPVSEPAAVEASPVERLIATRAELETAPEESVQPLFNVIEPRPGGYRLFLLLFGVVLPLISFTIELLTRISANELFDPMPTYWQVLAVAAVPAANLWAWRELRRPEPRYSWLLGGANGLALGVSVYYTILFLPLIPIGVVAVVFAGLGLLPLTPPLALIVTLIAARDLWDLRRRQNAEGRHWPVGSKSFWAGAALALISLVALELRTAVTRYHLQQAASGTPEARLRGLQRLRIMGNEELLLHACYYGFQRPTDLISFWFSLGDPVTAVQAREVYYRVTGRTFDSVPTPARNKQALLDVFDFNEDSDFGVGGREVGGILPGLSLAESRMDGSIDPDAALGYLEWTMVFRNSKGWQQEARAQVALPPGGTVSRLTLWVDGEEREAAFAARSKVQAAYENVVRQRRDPVLVTSSGDDRIMIQCFPVPPNGEMKIRFGITAPLYLPSRELGTLRLPRLHERNFGLGGAAPHSVWIESKGTLESSTPQLAQESPRPELHALRGAVSNDELAKSYPTIRAHRSDRVREVWTKDPQGRKGEIIQQHLEETPVPVPARVAILIDGSSGMRQSVPAIAQALAKLPDQIEYGVWMASEAVPEGTLELSPMGRGGSQVIPELSDRLRRADYRGGIDNLPALGKAWDLAARNADSAVIWIHEPVPILLSATDGLVQRLERRPDGPRIFDLQTADGPNRISEALDALSAVHSVTRTGNLNQDLERLFTGWRSGATRLSFRRERTTKPGLSDGASETSSHLARLWAFDEINRILAGGEEGRDQEAVKLASSYQLVTPVTGAVVLETKAQYRNAGLEPVKPGTVPTIPEPEEWLLMIVVAIVLTWAVYRRRATCRTA